MKLTNILFAVLSLFSNDFYKSIGAQAATPNPCGFTQPYGCVVVTIWEEGNNLKVRTSGSFNNVRVLLEGDTEKNIGMPTSAPGRTDFVISTFSSHGAFTGSTFSISDMSVGSSSIPALVQDMGVTNLDEVEDGCRDNFLLRLTSTRSLPLVGTAKPIGVLPSSGKIIFPADLHTQLKWPYTYDFEGESTIVGADLGYFNLQPDKHCVWWFNSFGPNQMIKFETRSVAPPPLATPMPTGAPSKAPSAAPSEVPSSQPSTSPSMAPSSSPSSEPSNQPSVAPSASIDMFDISYSEATFVNSGGADRRQLQGQKLDAIKLEWSVGDDDATASLSIGYRYYEPGCVTELGDDAKNFLQTNAENVTGKKIVSVTNTLSDLASAGLRSTKGPDAYQYSFCAAIVFTDQNGYVGNIQYVDVGFKATLDGTIAQDSLDVVLDPVSPVNDQDGKGALTATLYQCTSESGATTSDKSNVDLYSTEDGSLTSERKPLYLCLATDTDQVKIRHIIKLNAYFDNGDAGVTSQVIVNNNRFMSPLSVDNQGGVAACQNDPGSEVQVCKFAIFLRADEFPTDEQLKSVTFSGEVKLILEDTENEDTRRKMVRSLSSTVATDDYEVETVVSLNRAPADPVLDDEKDDCAWSFLNFFGLDVVCRLARAFNSMVARLASLIG